jgi:hypothetical protein
MDINPYAPLDALQFDCRVVTARWGIHARVVNVNLKNNLLENCENVFQVKVSISRLIIFVYYHSSYMFKYFFKKSKYIPSSTFIENRLITLW